MDAYVVITIVKSCGVTNHLSITEVADEVVMVPTVIGMGVRGVVGPVVVLGETERHDVTGVGDAVVVLLVRRGLSGGEATTWVQSCGTSRCLVGVGGLGRTAPTANEVAAKVG